jgi:hypothetical protein
MTSCGESGLDMVQYDGPQSAAVDSPNACSTAGGSEAGKLHPPRPGTPRLAFRGNSRDSKSASRPGLDGYRPCKKTLGVCFEKSRGYVVSVRSCQDRRHVVNMTGCGSNTKPTWARRLSIVICSAESAVVLEGRQLGQHQTPSLSPARCKPRDRQTEKKPCPSSMNQSP